MWQVVPNRNETPLATRATIIPMTGMPQPTPWENHMKFLPTTTCQQIWRWRDRDRKNTQTTAAQPPMIRNVPDAAQTELVFMEFGVIAS
jgi:hypothetical protein